jgi:mRNA interferase MazF
MRRGQFITVAIAGDYGKPRPALVVQSDLFADLPSVTVCPLTTTLRDDTDLIRIEVEPTPETGLRQLSHVTVDKVQTVALERVGEVIGMADDSLMLRVNRALAVFLGIA